ncbi:acyltransferase family protein [Hafnia paralvei]|uniref:acyltransferase family protein n=1 Tax=Hafnia paralvei TaxID=546367 RepID=UPI003C37F6FC
MWQFYLPFFILAASLAFTSIASKYFREDYKKSVDLTIEGLRGLACILVFINHSSVIFSKQLGIENHQLGLLGSFGVQIFFCITGFLFAGKIKKGNIDINYFASRIKRLAPLYIFVSTLILAYFLVLFNDKFIFSRDWYAIITQIYGFGFFGSGISLPGFKTQALNVITWTLPYEWKLYAIVPFIGFLYSLRMMRKVLFLIALISIFHSMYYGGYIIWSYFLIGFTCSYIPQKTGSKIKYNVFFSILLVSLIAYYYFSSHETYDMKSLFIVAVIFSICIYSKPRFLSFKPLAYIGTISYGVYLSHQLIIHASLQLYHFITGAWSVKTNLSLLVLLSMIMILSLIVSRLMYLFIEKRYM